MTYRLFTLSGENRLTKPEKNKLSLTTRKKRKPVSSCRENAYMENFSTLILLDSTTFLHFDSDKKKENQLCYLKT
ncbi:MAG: hypothetical protein P4L34_09590 [Paludibacter sp.]|nr:hypothetical protein [Paludibacter sp.]